MPRNRDQGSCRWCQKPIVVSYGMYGSSWVHEATGWVECSISGRAAEPEHNDGLDGVGKLGP